MTRARIPRPAVRPGAVARAAADPILDAIFERRTRRFALGAELGGALAFKSRQAPLPLAAEEEAILVAAATGITGVARDEWPFEPGTGAGALRTFTGRSFPSPLANHATEVFWTNDDGVFVLPQRDVVAARYRALAQPGATSELYRRAVQLQDGRLDVPLRSPNLFNFNRWIANAPGTTLFIPVADVTRQAISAMLLYFDDPHRYYIADPRLGGDPLRPLVEEGWFPEPAHPVDLWDFERWQLVDVNGVEHGAIIQNLGLATHALGLGGHPFSGGKGRITLGGTPLLHAAGGEGEAGSLGFTFHRVPDGAPVGAGELIPVGLEGVFEAAIPPWHDSIEDAVDAVIAGRSRGPLTPWTDGTKAGALGSPSPEAVRATKLLTRYIWDTYGRFPATVDPFVTTVWFQASHLDVEFSDHHYPDEAVTRQIRRHLAEWHGL